MNMPTNQFPILPEPVNRDPPKSGRGPGGGAHHPTSPHPHPCTCRWDLREPIHRGKNNRKQSHDSMKAIYIQIMGHCDPYTSLTRSYTLTHPVPWDTLLRPPWPHMGCFQMDICMISMKRTHQALLDSKSVPPDLNNIAFRFFKLGFLSWLASPLSQNPLSGGRHGGSQGDISGVTPIKTES